MIAKRKINVLIVFCLLSINLIGQKTTIYTHENETYNSALELFDKEKYGAAQEKFASTLKIIEDNKSEITVNAKYYHAICGLNLFNADAEGLLIEFINEYQESPKVKLAYFHLGRYKFRKKRYDDAIKWFTEIDLYDLNDDELAEYYFKVGYSHFMEEDLDKASKAFYEIKDSNTKYAPPARYYYAHIAYLKKQYQSSLQAFKLLEKEEKFAAIVPYYISQIYYLQKKYAELIKYAPPLLKEANLKRSSEIARLIGEAYYQKEDYVKAIPYLKEYSEKSRFSISRINQYQMGYAYYKSDSCKQAIKWFEKSITKEDSISQTAHYQLAECYLKLGEKKYARNSFRVASKLNFDPQIKEDALFSYAKISYELSYHPYNDAIIAFEKYINTYPKSKKLNTAYEYLVAVYFSTKNYKAALASLEKIKVRGADLKAAYQKIAYYRGVELFNNRKYDDAIAHFNKSDIYLYDKKIKALNVYWKGEANYRLENYREAIEQYENFVFSSGATSTEYINKVNYNMGYAYFKLKEYQNANKWFKEYITEGKNEKTKIMADALIRSGDCFFVTENYAAAIQYYDNAIKNGLFQKDYALFQDAFTNGIIGNYEVKAKLLETLISKHQKSHLLDDAIFELGETKLSQNKNEQALTYFKKLKTNYPNSPHLSKSLVKIGLIYYNKKDDKLALTAFKQVVKDYAGTDESKEALEKIKKIYIDKGELATYEKYLSNRGIANASTRASGSDYYEVAENSYMNGDCEKAVTQLTDYLEKYPNGSYLLNANYYKADCELKAGFENEALIGFNYVIAQPKNKFTENALLKAANINTNIGNTQTAIDNYNQLETLADIQSNKTKAQIEQMRLNFELKNYSEAIKYCTLIINNDVDDASLITETHLIYAKSAMDSSDQSLALKEFNIASTSINQFGAEAKFNIAQMLHLAKKYDECEAEVFSLIKKFASYDYWVGKSLILLADNYQEKGDLFQSKTALQNVIDNSKYPELVSTATQKLTLIETKETDLQNKPEEKDVDLNLMDDTDSEKLFDEEK